MWENENNYRIFHNYTQQVIEYKTKGRAKEREWEWERERERETILLYMLALWKFIPFISSH